MSGSGTDYTLTPNLNLFKPTYDADVEMWGTHLNMNSDIIDALNLTGGPFLPLAGGTVTGPVTFSGTTTLGAPISLYVDPTLVGAPALAIINPTTAYYPTNTPADSVWSTFAAQVGPNSLSQIFQGMYPNHNRSQTGIWSGALTVNPSGSPSLGAPQQSVFYASAISNDAVGVQPIVVTALAGIPKTTLWGLSTQLVDQPVRGQPNTTFNQVRLQHEFDYFVSHGDNTVRGILLDLSATVLSNNSNNWVAVNAGTFSSSVGRWGIAFQSGDGGADVGLFIGTLGGGWTPAANLPSQPINIRYADTGSSSVRAITIQANPLASGANLLFSSSYAGKANLQIQNQAALKGQDSTGNDVNIATVNGQNQLIIGGPIAGGTGSPSRLILRSANGAAMEFYDAGVGAINDIQILNALPGSPPSIQSYHGQGGTDVNIGLNILTLGTGTLALQTSAAPTTVGGTLAVTGATTFAATGTALTVTNNATIGGNLAVTGTIAARGTTTALNVNTTPVSTGADTTEDTLFTYTIPANTLSAVGDTIHVMAKGICLASTDSKQTRLRLNGVIVASLINNLAAQTTWIMEVWITKTGASAQSVTSLIVSATNNVVSANAQQTITDTAVITLTVTGQNTTAATAASITAQHLLVSVMRAP
jgi:hypothetical protein